MISVAGIPHPLALYSVHLPARTAAGQLPQAQRLANVIVQRGMLAHAAGDWNSIPAPTSPPRTSWRR